MFFGSVCVRAVAMVELLEITVAKESALKKQSSKALKAAKGSGIIMTRDPALGIASSRTASEGGSARRTGSSSSPQGGTPKPSSDSFNNDLPGTPRARPASSPPSAARKSKPSSSKPLGSKKSSKAMTARDLGGSRSAEISRDILREVSGPADALGQLFAGAFACMRPHHTLSPTPCGRSH